MKRREFITLVVSAAVWPFTAHAQPAMPVVGFVSGESLDGSARFWPLSAKASMKPATSKAKM